MRQYFKICMISAITLLLFGCASQKIWKSFPAVQQLSMAQFEIQIKPLKLDNPFFVAFELTVHNKSSAQLEINWNKTHYLHQGQEKGIFVFRGMDPQVIKLRKIPNERIPAAGSMTKKISPARTIAWMPRYHKPKPGELGFIPGILPNGANSVSLALSQNDKEWRRTLTVKIMEKTSP